LIPCTEKSASRAGSVTAPYPLHDKLSYVAGDYMAYGGEEKKKGHYTEYIQELGNWANSQYGNDKVRSIYTYLRKGHLIKDLVEDKKLFVDMDNRLIDKWDKKYEHLHDGKPDIFAVIAGEQESAFIRFNVYSPNNVLKKVWKDPEMFDSFVGYYSELLGGVDICYVTGRILPSTDKHANKIRNAGDKAKLISANDTSGFTFRGRFNESKEVASISYEVSQKAHNSLKWLINRQGKIIDDRVFLVWGNDELNLPGLTEDTFSIDPTPIERERKSFTNKEIAAQVSKAINGYKNDLSTQSLVNILILDSATTGRLAVLYYRNMNKEFYLDRLAKWHSSCVWLHRYRKDEEGEFVQFYGAPATKDIAFAAYGPRANDKIVKGLMERMLPCIVDEQRIPLDIENSAFHRASNPVAMEKWEWEKTLSITCALINRREEYNLGLDTENNDRDYLFGRLLAVADVLERRALGREETRSSNAIRFMNSFSKHPARTWKTIQESLQPYQARLGTKGLYWAMIIDEVASRIKVDEFNNKPLSGKYLLGFYSQRHELYQKKENSDDQVEESNSEGENK
jgi:CRISPR-associated protein Csd1